MTEQPNIKSASVPRYSLHGIEARDERRALIDSLAREARNLSAAEVRQLRRALFEDEGVSRAEAQALFGLDRAQPAPCAEWTLFFVHALTDHAVWQARPAGVVTHEMAEFLLREVDAPPAHGGHALLANVLAEADRVPTRLVEAARERLQTPRDISAARAAGAPGA